MWTIEWINSFIDLGKCGKWAEGSLGESEISLQLTSAKEALEGKCDKSCLCV